MKKIIGFLLISILMLSASSVFATNLEVNPDALTYKYSTTIEKERPEIDDTTKELIKKYRQNPTEENKSILRNKRCD